MKEAIDKLIAAAEAALQVGEIRFGSCALSRDVAVKLTEALAAVRDEMKRPEIPPHLVSMLTPEEVAKMDFSRPGKLVYSTPVGITCKYSCDECGLKRVEVVVPARPAEMEVTRWMSEVAAYVIYADHCCRSPRCKSNTMSEMMIPVTGAEHIGGPAVN